MQTKGALFRVIWPFSNVRFFLSSTPNHWDKTNKTDIAENKQANKQTNKNKHLCKGKWHPRAAMKGGKADNVSDYELSLSLSRFSFSFLTRLLLRSYAPLFCVVLYLASLRCPLPLNSKKLSWPSFSLSFPESRLESRKKISLCSFTSPWNCFASFLSFFHPPQNFNRPIPFHSPSFPSLLPSLPPSSIASPQNPDLIEFGYRYPCPDPATVSRCFSPPLGPSWPLYHHHHSDSISLSLSRPLFAHSFLPSSLTSSTHVSISFSPPPISLLLRSLSSRPSSLDWFPRRVFRIIILFHLSHLCFNLIKVLFGEETLVWSGSRSRQL